MTILDNQADCQVSDQRVKLLLRYVDHLRGCTSYTNGPCTCGFESAMRELADRGTAATSSPTPADRPTLNKLLSEFADTAIKCHIGYKHEGPWDKCEWIKCEDRRKLIESFAPAESTRVEGEAYSEGFDDAARMSRVLNNVTAAESARRAADEIAKYLDAFTPLSPGDELVRIFEDTIKRNLAATPADNDAELIEFLQQRRQYYDEGIFRPWTIEEGRKVQITFPNAVDRIAADSARRIIDVIISDIQAGEHHVSADNDTAKIHQRRPLDVPDES